jgi:hypothetical protein
MSTHTLPLRAPCRGVPAGQDPVPQKNAPQPGRSVALDALAGQLDQTAPEYVAPYRTAEPIGADIRWTRPASPHWTIAAAIARASELQIHVLARWLERRRTVTRLFAPVGPPRGPMVIGIDRGIG